MHYLLSNYQALHIHGSDAVKFLQGQLTCDVQKLAINASTLAANCDAKGKVHSIFQLYKASDESLFALMPQESLASTLAHLQKYAIFSSVAFTPATGVLLGTLNGEPMAQSTATFDFLNGIRVFFFNQENTPTVDATENATEWQIALLKNGIPQLTEATQDQFLPQALNLQEIGDCVSFTKGCYIGQEGVARAKYRGANKRAMFVFCAETECTEISGLQLLQQLDSGERPTGTVLMAIIHDRKLWIQAVLNEESPTESTIFANLNGTKLPLKLHPLPYA